MVSPKTQWGGPLSRSFVTGADGTVSYCRNLGLDQRTLACTALDTERRTWAADATSGRTPRTAVADRAWVTTAAGPAQCGRTGTPAMPRVTCSVLGSAGWQTSTAPGRTDWGTALSRAFVAGHDGTVSFCRTLGTPGHLRAACRTFHPETQTWSADDVATTSITNLPANATWLGATAGPALCWSPAAGVRGGCQVRSAWGWQVAKLSKKADAGAPATRAFLVGRGGDVSWCRIGGHSRVVACVQLLPSGNGWQTGRSTRLARALRDGATENRAWVATSAGPALCGRTGTARQQRVGCQVLTGSGWRFTGSQRTPWGLPGYRAFVPVGCRRGLLPDGGGHAGHGGLVHLDEPPRLGRHQDRPPCADGARGRRLRRQDRFHQRRLAFSAGDGVAAGTSRCAAAPLRLPPLAPARHLGLDVTRHGDQRRAVDRRVARLHHPGVELLEQATYLALGGVPVESGVELGVVLAQLEGRRQDAGDLLALDEPLDPPVRVVLGAEVLDRLPGPGQVVEVAALHGDAELLVDPLVLPLHPLGGRGLPGPLVALTLGHGREFTECPTRAPGEG